MLGPSRTPGDLRQVLLSPGDNPKGMGELESLCLEGWEAMDQEEMEFLVDLMSTLIE